MVWGFITFYERECTCLYSAYSGNIIGLPLPSTVSLLLERARLDFSEMTMKVIECDRERKERYC